MGIDGSMGVVGSTGVVGRMGVVATMGVVGSMGVVMVELGYEVLEGGANVVSFSHPQVSDNTVVVRVVGETGVTETGVTETGVTEMM